MMDKEIKMKLLEKIMEEMGDAEVAKFKKKEPEVMVKEVKADVLPISDAKDMIKEKMMGSEVEEEEEDIEDDIGEDDYMGEFYEKIKEKKRKMKELA